MATRRTAAALLALAALAGLGATASGDSGRSGHPATAQATAYAQRDQNGSQTDLLSVSGSGSKSSSDTSVRASTAGGKGSASASATVPSVNIFDGLVTADNVSVHANATARGTSTSGSVSGLVVDGKPEPSPAGRTVYDMGGYGTLVALSSGSTGILGLKAQLTKTYKTYKPGDTIIVGYASAHASNAVAAPARPAHKKAARPAHHRRKAHAKHKARRKGKGKPVVMGMLAVRAKLAREVSARDRALADTLLTLRGYGFPVAGAHNFTDTFGAARSDVPAHVGNDIFAAFGTPVVAVADGRLYRVGTLKISGNRLWLRDRHGYRYFYCHLSDFAASAYNGADVHAGEVIGFVGNTGDAEPTPPHLHFEVHMPDDQVVDPYPYLQKWDTTGVSSAAWLRRYGKDPGVRPGALVVVKDFLAEP